MAQNLVKPKQLFIVGGGSSIKESLPQLWQKINNRFVIGINYSYHHFKNPTFHVYLDKNFYKDNKEALDKLPLIITKPLKNLPSNVIQLKTITSYNRDVRKGAYKGSLSGIYALSLAIYLLDEGEIFLLGYDFCGIGKDNKGRAKTHYYENIEHRGRGKINYYGTKGRADRDFGVYKNEKKCKIYNVSLQSQINVFPKISYTQFFEMINNETFNQDELRKYIKERLK